MEYGNNLQGVFNDSNYFNNYINRNAQGVDRMLLGFRPFKQLNVNQQLPQSNPASGMWADPFGTAMSGTKTGTLQPYVNRMTQNASNALYGGLLGYSPQSMVAGDAGGTPQNSTAPQFNIPSALSQYGNGLNFTGFGNRSWMGK